MLLPHDECVSASYRASYNSHEKISCEKFSSTPDQTQKSLKNKQISESDASSTGLVYSSTSGTPTNKFQIDPLKSRAKKTKCSVLTSSRLHDQEMKQGGFRHRVAMLTLTYKDLDGWRPRHVSDLISHIRNWCKRRNILFRYVWVAELQKRGALHYHILIWLPKGISLPKPDKRGWWKHGFTKIEWARNAVGYVAKYASKVVDDIYKFPGGCRMHGCGGLNENSRNERRWWSMPSWIREQYTIEDLPQRAIGGGILLKSTGEIVPSPWKVIILSNPFRILISKVDVEPVK